MTSTWRHTSPPLRGLERWLRAEGIEFTTWDRWFLALVAADHGGDWQALRERLRAKLQRHEYERRDAEAKLSHLSDVEARWSSLRESARERLRRDCLDDRIVRRARSKIVEQSLEERHKTPAMREPPRVRLRARALRGYWPRFPVSPARVEPVFREVVPRDFCSERATFGLARRLEAALDGALRRSARPAEHLAVQRAFLTAAIDAFDCADDSCGVLGDLCRDRFPDYFTVPWREARLLPEVYYRDFLEWATWEDYGLTSDLLQPFFRAVAKEHVPLVDRILRELRVELVAADLEYQAERALTLRADLHVAKRRVGAFVDLALEMGSREWQRITTMAEAALRQRRRDLALAIFAAADQPGFHRERLRDDSLRLPAVFPSGRPQRAAPVRLRCGSSRKT
jgi:hypothetical protein